MIDVLENKTYYNLCTKTEILGSYEPYKEGVCDNTDPVKPMSNVICSNKHEIKLCGMDNKTYYNDCEVLKNNIGIAYFENGCVEDVNPLKKNEILKMNCNDKYVAPICGMNEKTYTNSCMWYRSK